MSQNIHVAKYLRFGMGFMLGIAGIAVAGVASAALEVGKARLVAPQAIMSELPVLATSQDKVFAAFYGAGQNNNQLLVANLGAASPAQTAYTLPEGPNKASGIGFEVHGDTRNLLWRPKFAKRKDLYFARADGAQGAFSEPLIINRDHNALLPILMRSNDKGLVVAAWHDERRGQERDVYANVSQDGGKTFLEKDIWVSKEYDHASTPALMLDGQDIHVFFVGQTIQNKKSKAAKRQEAKKQKSAQDKEKKKGDKSAAKGEPEKRDIYLVHRFSRDQGKTWKESRLTTLNATDTSDLLTPLHVTGQAGGAPRLWLVWRQGLAGLHGSYSDDRGVSWKATKLPPPPHGEYVVTMSAATAKDKIFISYARTFPGEPTAKPDVWIMQAHERGDRWDEPRRLSTEPHKLTQSFAPQVTANDSGQVVVVWQDYRNIRSGVYMNYSTDFGATWLPQDRVLEEPGKFSSTYPHIISLGGGRYDVVFLRYADDRFKEGGLWATRIDIK